MQTIRIVKREKKRVKSSRDDSYQSDLHGQSFVSSGTAFQLLQGFALVRNRRMIVLMLARWIPVATIQTGMGAPVGEIVASPKIVDGEWWVCGDVKV